MNEVLWGDMLNVLKDISGYLEKQDSTQETVKLADVPKTGEDQKEMSGGPDPVGTPGKIEGFKKEFVPEDDEDEKEDEDKEDKKEDKDDEKEDKKDIDELKSLLKDISSALQAQSVQKANTSDIAELVNKELKKALPNIIKSENDKLLRKQGFVPTRADVTKIDVNKANGLDTVQEVAPVADIVKSEDKNPVDDANKAITDLAKKSWTELGQIRENIGGFKPFER